MPFLLAGVLFGNYFTETVRKTLDYFFEKQENKEFDEALERLFQSVSGDNFTIRPEPRTNSDRETNLFTSHGEGRTSECPGRETPYSHGNRDLQEISVACPGRDESQISELHFPEEMGGCLSESLASPTETPDAQKNDQHSLIDSEREFSSLLDYGASGNAGCKTAEASDRENIRNVEGTVVTLTGCLWKDESQVTDEKFAKAHEEINQHESDDSQNSFFFDSEPDEIFSSDGSASTTSQEESGTDEEKFLLVSENGADSVPVTSETHDANLSEAADVRELLPLDERRIQAFHFSNSDLGQTEDEIPASQKSDGKTNLFDQEDDSFQSLSSEGIASETRNTFLASQEIFDGKSVSYEDVNVDLSGQNPDNLELSLDKSDPQVLFHLKENFKLLDAELVNLVDGLGQDEASFAPHRIEDYCSITPEDTQDPLESQGHLGAAETEYFDSEDEFSEEETSASADDDVKPNMFENVLSSEEIEAECLVSEDEFNEDELSKDEDALDEGDVETNVFDLGDETLQIGPLDKDRTATQRALASQESSVEGESVAAEDNKPSYKPADKDLCGYELDLSVLQKSDVFTPEDWPLVKICEQFNANLSSSDDGDFDSSSSYSESDDDDDLSPSLTKQDKTVLPSMSLSKTSPSLTKICEQFNAKLSSSHNGDFDSSSSYSESDDDDDLSPSLTKQDKTVLPSMSLSKTSPSLTKICEQFNAKLSSSHNGDFDSSSSYSESDDDDDLSPSLTKQDKSVLPSMSLSKTSPSLTKICEQFSAKLSSSHDGDFDSSSSYSESDDDDDLLPSLTKQDKTVLPMISLSKTSPSLTKQDKTVLPSMSLSKTSPSLTKICEQFNAKLSSSHDGDFDSSSSYSESDDDDDLSSQRSEDQKSVTSEHFPLSQNSNGKSLRWADKFGLPLCKKKLFTKNDEITLSSMSPSKIPSSILKQDKTAHPSMSLSKTSPSLTKQDETALPMMSSFKTQSSISESIPPEKRHALVPSGIKVKLKLKWQQLKNRMKLKFE
ncbi:dentin sialophosphoprotein-like [Nothobranchius furzeri]|uniref:dentin sialophosphoprotein-like n=1 Tax=Nothobranchius furzeri TaxID=105023 RepID=UPI003904B75B